MPSPHFATTRPRDAVRRYSEAERLTHWAVALAYILLFLSGLAMFHPFFWWISALFGSGALMRVLHPYIGVALAALFLAYASRLWRENLLSDSDRRWLRHSTGYIRGSEEVRVEGKYNAGQKLMYWSLVIVIPLLLLSGIALWRPWFAPSLSLTTRRIAALVHVISAFVMFVGIGIHVYAALWTRGSMRAMTQGWVSPRWARYHHPGWYERVTASTTTREPR